VPYNIAVHFFIIKSIWKSAWRYVISWRAFSYGFYNKKVRCDLWPNVQGHLKILYDLVIAEHWVSLIDSIRFESVQIGSSRFESALFNSSRFESVQIEPLRVGLTALIELNRTEWATSIPSSDRRIMSIPAFII